MRAAKTLCVFVSLKKTMFMRIYILQSAADRCCTQYGDLIYLLFDMPATTWNGICSFSLGQDKSNINGDQQ